MPSGAPSATMDPVDGESRQGPATVVAMLLLGACVALVATGFAKGPRLANAHNGLLALAFGTGGVWTLLARPWHREGLLFGAAGLAQAVLFLGRQIGLADPTAIWWAWLGVWPLALVITLVTWAVLCFPEGRFLSARWRRFGYAVLIVGAVCAALSALWPVEYAAAGIDAAHPFAVPGRAVAERVWTVLAHPAYALCQLSWVAVAIARWRASNGAVRRQLAVVAVAAAVSGLALLAGLAVWRSPRLGLLLTPVVPLAAWWAMERMSVAKVIEQTRARGQLDGLTPRENDVLDLMAQGLSNQAIATRLHLSVKTIEPVVSAIFTKLDLPADSASNRRVLAVLAYLRE